MISGKTRDYAAYNALSNDLNAYNNYLVPEITMDAESHFVLVISCNGYKQGSPAVEELTKDIKDYANWKIIKYRQPGPMELIPLKGQKVGENGERTVQTDLSFKMAPKQPDPSNRRYFAPGSHYQRI